MYWVCMFILVLVGFYGFRSWTASFSVFFSVFFVRDRVKTRDKNRKFAKIGEIRSTVPGPTSDPSPFVNSCLKCP